LPRYWEQRVHHCLNGQIKRTVMTFDGWHHRSGLGGPGTTKQRQNRSRKGRSRRHDVRGHASPERNESSRGVRANVDVGRGVNPRPHRDHAGVRPRVPLGRLRAIANPAELNESLCDSGKLPKRWGRMRRQETSPTPVHAVWQSPRTRLDGNTRILLMRCDHPSQDQID
jgi:hypothetical protein